MNKKGNKEEGNKYDKIFKENIDATIDGFIRKILKVNVIKSEKIVLRLQRTKEREADFLKIITDDKGNRFILHLEYQVENDAEMVHRMHDYCALLIRKYKIRVEQYVLYFGSNKPNMETKISYPNIKFNYHLINFKTINYLTFLNSEKPEEIILTILGNFQNQKPENIVKSIVKKVESSEPQSIERQKIFQQLLVLGRLRKLDIKIQEIMDSISQYIKIEEDELYLQGKETQALKDKQEFVNSLLTNTDFSVEKIAFIVGVSVEFVLGIKAK